MQVDRTDYIPFMDGVKEIFSQKMKAAKASKLKGWSARTLLKEITEEQSLTPAEQNVAWGILIVDILGYDDNKIKEMEDDNNILRDSQDRKKNKRFKQSDSSD